MSKDNTINLLKNLKQNKMEDKHFARKVDNMRSDVVDIIDELVQRIEQLESENEDLREEIYSAKNTDNY